MSVPTNDDVADISQAIRQRLKERGEIAGDEVVYRAIDQGGQTFDLPISAGDRLRLFRRTWGTIDGREQQVGNNGNIVEVLDTMPIGFSSGPRMAAMPMSNGVGSLTVRPAGC